MKPAFLVASAAYTEPELEAEFGRIPPAFLPLGNKRLYVRQMQVARQFADRVILSLPETFRPSAADRARLDDLGYELVFVPEELILGQSIVYVINVLALSGATLALLHGDTLLRGLDFGVMDQVSVATSIPPGYRWGPVRTEDDTLEILGAHAAAEDGNAVLTGFFSFSSTALLVQAITRAGGSFLDGLKEYSHARELRPLSGGEWFDFGHSGTYHRSRSRFTTERAFNHLTASRHVVWKSSHNKAKIAAEALWFENLPAALRLHTPAYLGSRADGDGISYALEYLHLPTLADLAAFGRLQFESWQLIFGACDEFLSACAAQRPPVPPAQESSALYLAKTMRRLEEYARTSGLSLTAPCSINGAALPSIEAMVRRAADSIPPAAAAEITLVHGDFCFSNIFYDMRADLVRVIDPRGTDAADAASAFGDIRYDIGKLYHSAVGLYDQIIVGNYRLERNGALDFGLEFAGATEMAWIGKAFLEQKFAGRGVQQAAAPAIAVLLFFSMLPLHADDTRRQAALLANGLRLFHALDQG